MFQYVLALLLINTYYQSFGAYIPPVISNSLLALEKQCENKFLLEQIHSKSQDCNLLAPPYNYQQFQCLMFFDINQQLCSAVTASKLVLKEDYAAKINENQDISTFCTAIKGSVFTNLTDFPQYKGFAEKIFNTSATCGKVCGYSEITNEDTKYYCKYFMWGLNMLKNQPTAPPTKNETGDTVLDPDTSYAEITANSLNEHELNLKSPNVLLKPILSDVHTDEDKLTLANGEETGEASVPKKDILAHSTDNTDRGENKDDNNSDIDLTTSNKKKNLIPTNDSDKTKINLVSEVLGQETDKDVKVDTKLKDSKTQEDVLSPDVDLGQDPEEDIDGVEDADGEILGQEHDVKEQQDPVKNTLDISHKEYARTDADEYTEEGDNFFPFFLTAVILVALLYILYHNKNKVTKVFFGLILEGRANSRRRNSRGHAYRRLDTLEQAMSDKTTTPPSKIIY